MPKPDVSHERIPQILDAAAELFGRRGIDAAGMNELSRATGMSKAAIYHYFPSKDSIVHGLIERLFTTDQPHLKALVEDTTRNAADRLLEYVEGLADFVSENSEIQPVVLESYSKSARDPVIAELIRKSFHRYHDLCEQIILQGIAMGEFDASLDSKTVTATLVAQVEGSILIGHLTDQKTENLLRQNLSFIIEQI